jgi:pimeloyl-ACP methyl ester carboxylesterase
MLEQPETRYARSGEANIAYQVTGAGPLDVVFVPGLLSQIDLIWTLPAAAGFFSRLAAFARVITYDKRGQGVSDPLTGELTLEQDMEDLVAVLDAAGSERAALIGYSEGGPMSALAAATHSDRVSALVLCGTFASGTAMIGGPRAGERMRLIEEMLENWGQGRGLEIFAPSISGEGYAQRFGAFERAVGSPAMVRARLAVVAGIDVTPVLESLRVPTLVIHRSGDRAVPRENSQQMAKAIPGARYVELPGDDHIPWVGDAEPVLEAIEEFLTGARQGGEPNRVLATVLFTDIVDSTRRASEIGDRRWQTLLRSHDELVRERLGAFRGREIKAMGDGFLVTFDGPARGIRCARSIVHDVEPIGMQVRAGLHTGECELIGEDVGGLAVNIGARVGGLAARQGPGGGLGHRVQGARRPRPEGRAGHLGAVRRRGLAAAPAPAARSSGTAAGRLPSASPAGAMLGQCPLCSTGR